MSRYTKKLTHQNERNLKYIERQRPRGYKLICLAAQGFTNKEIAKIMGISFYTIKDQLADMYFWYAAKNKTHLVAKTVQAGVKVFDE